MKRIAVAMSGGVDSLVSAILLKRSGVSLMGVYMKNWDERDEGGGGGGGRGCMTEADFSRVQQLCATLDIPCVRVDFVKEYWNEVFSHSVEAYEQGHTPNPDVLCNRHIKFSALHRYCRHHLNVGTIATGHYARVERGEKVARLKMAVDRSKDQTYFLSQISQRSLARTLFPVGGLKKEEVKKIAVEAGFPLVARQKESMGLCFIGKRDFRHFISQYIEEVPGPFVTLEGKQLGCHKGHHLYTVGQRARVSGQPLPLFVAGKNPATNAVKIVEGREHPALYVTSFTTSSPHWIANDPFLTRGTSPRTRSLRCQLRYRHLDPLVEVEVERNENGCLQVHCSHPLRVMAPGQYAVFYIGEECMGGACISATGPSLWQQQQTEPNDE